MAFGDIIQELRNDTGLKQSDVALYLGIASSTLSNYETNVIEPSFTTLKKIALYFNVSTDYLLEITRDRTSKADMETEIEIDGEIVPLHEILNTLNTLSIERRTLIIKNLRELRNSQRLDELKQSKRRGKTT